jgi:GST-like protein
MIDLYTWTTPNGRKVSIMLEECGLPYRTHKVDIGKGDQFREEFVSINPNSKIPAILDYDGPNGRPLKLFESGAILIYLSGKSGRFLPSGTRGKYKALQWLMFQMGGVGPMFGQVHHFLRAAKEPIPYAIERYTKETRRLYSVLNRRASAFLAEVLIAILRPIPGLRSTNGTKSPDRFPHVKRWFDIISARPAVARGMAVPQ